jgi:hypothetical protein
MQEYIYRRIKKEWRYVHPTSKIFIMMDYYAEKFFGRVMKLLSAIIRMADENIGHTHLYGK